MNIANKSILRVIIIIISLCFVKCKNDHLNTTGITEIDIQYKFIDKVVHKFNKDSIYTNVEMYYAGRKEDSVYLIGTKQKNGYNFRTRGWEYNDKRIGDWYYEKVYGNRVTIDSILNYVVKCDKNYMNTIKKFKNNTIDKSVGYFYEIDMKKDVFINDTLEIKLNFVFDTVHFEKAANEFYMFNPPSLNDYYDVKEHVIDSFPVYKNSTKMRFIMDEKGKTKLLGYYYLVPKKRKNKEYVELLPVFTEINFEVK